MGETISGLPRINKEQMLRNLGSRLNLIIFTVEHSGMPYQKVWETLTLVADFRQRLADHPDRADLTEIRERYRRVIWGTGVDYISWFGEEKSG